MIQKLEQFGSDEPIDRIAAKVNELVEAVNLLSRFTHLHPDAPITVRKLANDLQEIFS